jgi:hypothetical protein
VRLVDVAQELSTIEERLEEQSCLFQTGSYSNKSHNSKKLFWVSIPNVIFCGLESKHYRRTVPRQMLLVSDRKLEEQRSQCYKSVLGSSPDEYITVAVARFLSLTKYTDMFHVYPLE